MPPIYRSRGHFANYCRKILKNKQHVYDHDIINPIIWAIWDLQNTTLMTEFVTDLQSINPISSALFNLQLVEINKVYCSKIVQFIKKELNNPK